MAEFRSTGCDQLCSGGNEDVERGGQITLFTKDDCPYCVRVKDTLENCVARILKENPQGKITWKEIKCVGADASLCVRLTGSFSVPHVFFNREYIGDCSKTCACAAITDEDKNSVLKKLKDIALGPKLDPPFPPPPDAIMTKITDDVACSSQPTEEQLSKLSKAFGIKSVLNLSSPMESSFFQGEGDLLLNVQPDFVYTHTPLVDLSPESICRVVDESKKLPKPMLVHCDTGQRALMIALLIATEGEEQVDESNFVLWGEELNINLQQLASRAVNARAWRKSNHQLLQNNKSGQPNVKLEDAKNGNEAKELKTEAESIKTTLPDPNYGCGPAAGGEPLLDEPTKRPRVST